MKQDSIYWKEKYMCYKIFTLVGQFEMMTFAFLVHIEEAIKSR